MPFTKLLIWIMILFINFHNIVTDKTTTKDPKKEFCKINKFDQVVDVLLPGSRVTYFIVNRIYWPVLTIVNGYDYKLSLTSAEAIQGASVTDLVCVYKMNNEGRVRYVPCEKNGDRSKYWVELSLSGGALQVNGNKHSGFPSTVNIKGCTEKSSETYFIIDDQIRKNKTEDILHADAILMGKLETYKSGVSFNGIFVWNDILYGLDTNGTKIIKVNNMTDTKTLEQFFNCIEPTTVATTTESFLQTYQFYVIDAILLCLVGACLCLLKKYEKNPESLSVLTITRSIRSQPSNRLDQQSDEKLPDDKGSSDKVKDRESSGPTKPAYVKSEERAGRKRGRSKEKESKSVKELLKGIPRSFSQFGKNKDQAEKPAKTNAERGTKLKSKSKSDKSCDGKTSSKDEPSFKRVTPRRGGRCQDGKDNQIPVSERRKSTGSNYYLELMKDKLKVKSISGYNLLPQISVSCKNDMKQGQDHRKGKEPAPACAPPPQAEYRKMLDQRIEHPKSTGSRYYERLIEEQGTRKVKSISQYRLM